MTTCSTARPTISALGGQLADTPALDLAIQGCIEVEQAHFPDKPIYEAAAHMENCVECQAWSADWLDKLYPERAQRRERLAKYCCVSMFDAVTLPDAATKFSFTMFRGEDACWCINDEYVFARFCPWCGQALPHGPFEPDGLVGSAGSS
jgi:hypothetical protein